MSSYDKVAVVRIERYPCYDTDGNVHYSYGVTSVAFDDKTETSLMGYLELEVLLKDLKETLKEKWEGKVNG